MIYIAGVILGIFLGFFIGVFYTCRFYENKRTKESSGPQEQVLL